LVVANLLGKERISSDVMVSLAVVGDRKMKQLNRQYHQVDGTTDVLSFPYNDPESNSQVYAFVMHEEEGAVLGDVVVSYPQAVKQAQARGVLVDEEMDFLVEHGLMHLLGKHHD
jgi:probable rRNA maturation factor